MIQSPFSSGPHPASPFSRTSATTQTSHCTQEPLSGTSQASSKPFPLTSKSVDEWVALKLTLETRKNTISQRTQFFQRTKLSLNSWDKPRIKNRIHTLKTNLKLRRRKARFEYVFKTSLFKAQKVTLFWKKTAGKRHLYNSYILSADAGALRNECASGKARHRK